jgi:O-antigen/teichoic acid export membrane protein
MALRLLHLPLTHRLLDPLPLAILLFTTSLNMVMFAQAVYLRAHKQEKFLLNSVLGAVLVSISTIFLGRAYGSLGIVIGSLCIGSFMGMPLGTYTFIKYRRLWHEQ